MENLDSWIKQLDVYFNMKDVTYNEQWIPFVRLIKQFIPWFNGKLNPYWRYQEGKWTSYSLLGINQRHYKTHILSPLPSLQVVHKVIILESRIGESENEKSQEKKIIVSIKYNKEKIHCKHYYDHINNKY